MGDGQNGARQRRVPWKSSTPVDLRTELIHRVLDGEKMARLCREYGISTKTGWKFFERFKRLGLVGLSDRSRAPHEIPHKTSPELVKLLIDARKKHPTWGPKKLKVVLEKRLKREFPAASTIGDILDRSGLIEPRRHRARHRATSTTLNIAKAPNDIWCIDYKGQFRLGNGTYCYPLTLSDQFSRFILSCEAMPRISEEGARDVCEEVFRRHGLPLAIRSDNGPPFASTGLAGLTKLSAYWMQLGIRLERIRPAHPEENGRHERMHRTLKFDAAKPPRKNLLQQQERFDAFVDEFNRERPHEALAMKSPADVYKESSRRYPDPVPVPTYDEYDDVRCVGRAGFLTITRKTNVYISRALVGMHVGISELPDGRWLVAFMDMSLGLVDPSQGRLMPLPA
jgi:transposase InsO family protein